MGASPCQILIGPDAAAERKAPLAARARSAVLASKLQRLLLTIIVRRSPGLPPGLPSYGLAPHTGTQLVGLRGTVAPAL